MLQDFYFENGWKCWNDARDLDLQLKMGGLPWTPRSPYADWRPVFDMARRSERQRVRKRTKSARSGTQDI